MNQTSVDLLAASDVEVIASAHVILSDGASVTITVRTLFNPKAQPEAVIQGTILSYFMSDGTGITLTLAHLKNDPNYEMQLIQRLMGLLNIRSASVIGYSVTSPPIEWVADKSKTVSAILLSGETVQLKFASPTGMPPPPSTAEVTKVYSMLSSMKRNDLPQAANLLKQTLADANRGWDYLLVGLELKNCSCS